MTIEAEPKRPRRIVVSGRYVLAPAGGLRVLPNHSVVIEGSRIADVTAEPVVDADLRIDAPDGFVVPGFINLHCHCMNAPLFRSVTDDLPVRADGTSHIYSLLMPMGQLAMSLLSPVELRDFVSLGILEVIRGGATTLLDMFRPEQAVTMEVARDWGLRLYAAPYLFSPDLGATASVRRRETGLDTFRDLHRRYDDGPRGKLRVILGPHAADTCGPELLGEVRRTADELDTLVTLHLGQSRAELASLRERYGQRPTGYLDAAGLLREGTIVAHGIYLEEDELDRLAATGTALANCAAVFARSGRFAPFGRFASRGVRTGIGTDAERMDFLSQMRFSGFVSKLEARRSDAATAPQLLDAVTAGSADILRRPDLGRLAPGSAADLVVIDLGAPRLRPVRDPVTTAVWYAGQGDIRTVIVDGEPLVLDGRAVFCDEGAVAAAGAAATAKVWRAAEASGILPVA